VAEHPLDVGGADPLGDQARAEVVDEDTDLVQVKDVRTRDGLADVRVEVRERLERERGSDARLGLERSLTRLD
jgi:hypothetical protein